MWEVRLSNSRGVPYFFNTESQQSSWDSPAELTPEQIKQLPGAAEYLERGSKASSGGRPTKVRASHLLVKHKGSRRPASWKESNITRSKEEAIKILRGYQAQINGSAETFAQLATEHSDCSSHANGGDLGWFEPGQMQKPFEDGAYGLQVGQISDVISSDSGVHLILRTG
jgi:NIMA-interacting peptidyl-prolyl cis-trans isomerase 1